MKNFVAAALGLVILSASMISCSKTNDTTQANAGADSTVNPGKYTISSFTQRGEDKSAKLAGYTFTFTKSSANAGTITASNGSNSQSGNWNYAAAVTYYGSSSKTSITIGLGTETPFERVSKLWNVVSVTPNQISLVSPEVADDEHLVFSK